MGYIYIKKLDYIKLKRNNIDYRKKIKYLKRREKDYKLLIEGLHEKLKLIIPKNNKCSHSFCSKSGNWYFENKIYCINHFKLLEEENNVNIENVNIQDDSINNDNICNNINNSNNSENSGSDSSDIEMDNHSIYSEKDELSDEYESERLNEDYRSKNHYNLCKIKGCMFLTEKDFCKNHINNENLPNDELDSNLDDINNETNNTKVPPKSKKINKYNLETAIDLFHKTIEINKNVKLNENIDADIDFKRIVKDIYINNYDKINLYSRLQEYIEDDDESYIDEIKIIFNIDTKDKMKKLNQKLIRCKKFIDRIKNISGNNIMKTLFSPSFFIKMKKKDFDEYLKYIEEYKNE